MSPFASYQIIKSSVINGAHGIHLKIQLANKQKNSYHIVFFLNYSEVAKLFECKVVISNPIFWRALKFLNL